MVETPTKASSGALARDWVPPLREVGWSVVGGRSGAACACHHLVVIPFSIALEEKLSWPLPETSPDRCARIPISLGSGFLSPAWSISSDLPLASPPSSCWRTRAAPSKSPRPRPVVGNPPIIPVTGRMRAGWHEPHCAPSKAWITSWFPRAPAPECSVSTIQFFLPESRKRQRHGLWPPRLGS